MDERVPTANEPEEISMGAFEKIKGKFKQQVGEVTGNDGLQREGKAQESKGEAESEASQARAEAKVHDAEAAAHEIGQKAAERTK